MNKRYLIKSYELDWSFKEIINENIVSSSISFTENINWWQWQLSLLLNKDFTNTDIEKSNFIKVFIYDDNYSNGNLIYTWIVERIKRIYTANTNQVEIVCLWLWSLLTRLYFEKNWNKKFSETTKTAWEIVRNIIDYFNSEYSWNWLNSNELDITWTNIDISFDFTICFEAIKNLSETAWFYFFIKKDWTVVFKPKQLINTHKFTAWKDLQNLTIEEDIYDLENKIYLDYNWWQVNNKDSNSINKNWKIEKKENRSDVSNNSTANTTLTNILNNRKEPKQKTTLQINTNYILENIHPWDNVRINNLNYTIDNKQIQKITYTPELVTINLEEFDSIWQILTN